ncbi:MAG: metalloregulator ArsR/SmtB family transcription factor [Erysipelotrichaceae bacterium]|nr:metalloregulator ArsR/SmtB family transcription factor [Erysipelotrichaceae bacterium]MDD3924276.1 metalloregulator ArsR/SmtB family transcription factor [Erysipelotrichaceae bacterium]MDD4642604.1 metalloregulator ArsR/SmtB family transcription factor [Erysipelotrichaceae bacterium]
MNENVMIIKAIADESRYQIVKLLLEKDYCVSGLAYRLGISEAAVSQHIKILKEAKILYGEKRGYFMHYYVNHERLRSLIDEIDSLLIIKRKACIESENDCHRYGRRHCRKINNELIKKGDQHE